MNNIRHSLRIIQVNTSDLGGGAESSAWNLFQAYRQRGFDSWLVVGYKFSEDPNVFIIPNEDSRSLWTRLWRHIQAYGTRTLAKPLTLLLGKLARLGEPCHFVERHLSLGIEDFNYPGTWHLLDLPPRRPTVVHCHNLHGNYFDLRTLPWLSKQVPVIINLRDAWLLGGHCAHSLGCERWKMGCGRCPDLTIYPSVPRDTTSYNWRRKRDIYAKSRLYITAPSQWLIDRVKESMLHGVQYRVIPNAIDLNMFRPGNRDAARYMLDLPKNAKIVLLTAHNMFKDLVTMKTALARINIPDTRDDLLFICLGKNGFEQPLGQGRIRYMGIERDPLRLVLYYQASNVYIHAALGEAFGKTIAESMACGIPVVATAVGGIPEQIEDGITGFLVPPFGIESMTRAIQRLLIDENLYKQMAESAAIHATKRFGLDRQVDDFLRWYDEVLEDWSKWKYNAMSNP